MHIFELTITNVMEKAPHYIKDLNDLDAIVTAKLYSFNITPTEIKIDQNYYYWDKIKYLKTDYGDSEYLWQVTKMKRKFIEKKILLKSSNSSKISFNYNINQYLQQKLHYLDFNFGAGIQKEKLLSNIDKHRYLTNSLMEESIFHQWLKVQLQPE